MMLFLLLEITVGEIRKGVMEPPTTLTRELEYYTHTPSLNSIISILDIMVGMNDLSRYRSIQIPLGLSLSDTYRHLSSVSASAYLHVIPTKPIVINDWFRNNERPLSVSSVISELRKILITHTLKDNVHPMTDEYMMNYYHTLIMSIIRTSC